jgi:hypothetical protein
MTKHIIIYSHGFGVKKDDRGLFPDIADGLPDIEHILFNYNQVDEENNRLLVVPIEQQVQKLTDVFAQTKRENPNAKIDIIAHSFGCIIAALAKLPAYQTIFLVPSVATVSAEEKFRTYIMRYPGVTVKNNKMTIPRRDGSTTIIRKEYWPSFDDIPDVPSLYNAIPNLTIIGAIEDEVIGRQDYSKIADGVKIIEIHADHNFKNDSRRELVKVIEGVLK